MSQRFFLRAEEQCGVVLEKRAVARRIHPLQFPDGFFVLPLESEHASEPDARLRQPGSRSTARR